MVKWLRTEDPGRYESLLNAIQSQDGCVLFVGAGPSTIAGYPGWEDLVNNLVARAGLDSSVLPPKTEETYHYQVAEMCHGILGDSKYHTALEEIFDPRNKDPFRPIHLELLYIPFRAYMTANYDMCLERAKRDVGREMGSIYWYPNLDPSALKTPRPNFFHLHGIVFDLDLQSHAPSTLLTMSQIKKAYEEEDIITDMLKAVYGHSTVLFIGFRPQEHYFTEILKIAKQRYDQARTRYEEVERTSIAARHHFALLSIPYLTTGPGNPLEPDTVRMQQEDELLEKLGVLTLRYEAEDQYHNKLTEIIEDMRNRTSSTTAFELPELYVPS